MRKSALIIANWQYDDTLLRELVAPSHDSESLAEVLRDQTIGGFEVQRLTNEPSNRVCEDIEAFFSDREKDDMLLFYFSGHGVTDDDGQLYYATSNTLHKRLKSTAVAASWVNNIMNQCRSRRQILLLDCCHSGAVGRTKAAASVNVSKYFAGTTPEEGLGKFILTASDAFQYSFEGDQVEGKGVNSVFTDAVVEGLRTGAADSDGDGHITLDELYSYVYKRVRERTSQQTPRKWASDVEGELIIAANPTPAEAPLPEDLQAAIDSFVIEARMSAIPRLDKLLHGKHRGKALTAHRVILELVNDDSRRVSAAAERCLADYSEELAAVQADADRIAKQKTQVAERAAQAERLATDRAEAERVAKEKADTALRRGRKQAERKRAVTERAKAERIAATKVATVPAEVDSVAKGKAHAADRAAQPNAKRARTVTKKTAPPTRVPAPQSVRNNKKQASGPGAQLRSPARTSKAKPAKSAPQSALQQQKVAPERRRKLGNSETEKIQLAARKAAQKLLIEWQKRERAKKLEQTRLAKQRAEEKRSRQLAEEERIKKERLAAQNAAAERELARLKRERAGAAGKKRPAIPTNKRKTALASPARTANSSRILHQSPGARARQKERLAAQSAAAERELERLKRERAAGYPDTPPPPRGWFAKWVKRPE
jgi:hypothetical protein